MNDVRFEAGIIRGEHVFGDVVRERVYGAVRMTAAWPDDRTSPEIRIAMTARGDVDHRDAPAYAELFFHDVFLLMNIAAPGSFGGTISISGGDLVVRELTFSARLFACAKVVERLSLASVTAWYDRVAAGTRQRATSDEASALFQLLHLASAREDDETSVLRLARAAEALLGRRPELERLFELRDQIARGQTPAFHPMHDDSLDPSVEDATAEWIHAADAAAHHVVSELQRRVRAS